MAVVNYIYNVLKGAVAQHIVDLPDITKEQREEIADKAAEFVLDLVNEVSEGAAEGFIKGLKE